MQKTDLELVEEFRRGNVGGFNELVRRYQQKTYWTARRIVGSHEDADDVVQDVFLRVFRALARFRGESGFYTWLYRITVNVSLNTVRIRKVKEFIRYDELLDQRTDTADRPDDPLMRKEQETMIERAIEQLPPKQRAVFVMRYYDEIPYEEMARMLHRSVGGLKANYFHALKKIQRFIRRESAS